MTDTLTAPEQAPTASETEATLSTPDQQDSPPQESQSDTPAWQRAASREEALAALLGDEELPSEELLKHPKLQGLIGTKAKIQAQQDREREKREERERRRREAAARGDFHTLGEDVAPEYTPDPQAELAQQLTSDARDHLAPFIQKLPKDLADELEHGDYSGSFGEGLSKWANAYVDARLKAELPAAVEKEIKKRGLVPKAQAEAERVNEEGAPELSVGSPSNRKTYRTQREVEADFVSGLATSADVRAARRTLPY